MGRPKLYAVKKWGSAIVELTLEHTGFDCEVEFLEKEFVRTADFKKLNPLSQIPTLILPDGTIMTESLAICLYIHSQARSTLVPSADSIEYPQFLRWAVFLTGSIYSVAPYADHPDWFVSGKVAQDELRAESLKRLRERFLMLERQCRAPYFLGTQLSLIDLYLSIMTYWDPGPAWFQEHCPKIMANVEQYQKTPEFRAVAERNLRHEP